MTHQMRVSGYWRAGAWAVCMALLSACNSGSGGFAGPGATGSVAVLITDAPIDDLAEINLSIARIELLDDDRRVTLFEGTRTVNLLDFQAYSELVDVASDVPAGLYEKIRLTLHDLELVRLGQDGQTREAFHPRLPGNRKVDLNPRGAFFVTPEATLIVRLDFDMAKAIFLHEHDGEYQFRPVVFVELLGQHTDGLVSVSGTVGAVDPDAQSFSLCSPMFRQWHGSDDDEDNDCLHVLAGPQTAFYVTDATSAVFGDLLPGDSASVLGRFSIMTHSNRTHVLEAEVVSMGSAGAYAKLHGAISTPPDASGAFGFRLDPGQGFGADTELRVQLSEGARVFSMDGGALSRDDLVGGLRGAVLGILALSDTALDQLRAAVVVLDTQPAPNRLTGILGGDLSPEGFTLITDSFGDRCIQFADGVNVLETSSGDTGLVSRELGVSDLKAGRLIEVYGRDGAGCLVATDVLAAV